MKCQTLGELCVCGKIHFLSYLFSLEEEELDFILMANLLMVQFTNMSFLVGHLGRHQKTYNCLYEMCPFIALNDKLKLSYNYKIKVT